MNKDYFQDITPHPEEHDVPHVPDQIDEVLPVPEKSIRNVNVTRRVPDRREVPPVGAGLPIRRVGINTYWLWGCAALVLFAIAGASIFMFRKTSVTIVPRSHTVVFDANAILTAYPAASAATSSLTYNVQSFDLEDSATVASQGSSHAEHKASGSVVVANEFSSSPVRLIKDTRFETPDGLTFRTPADIQIPGMKGKSPGVVSVTLVADAAGANYNVGPFAKLTVPGLKGGAMYAKISARSTQPFSGGFSGTEPSVPQNIRDAAVSEIRGRLQDAIAKKIASFDDNGIVFSNFAKTTFADGVITPDTGNQVRMTIKAHVDVPVIDKRAFLASIGSQVSTDVQDASLEIVPRAGYAAQLVDQGADALSLTTPIRFSVTGTADLIWHVDTVALTNALVSKNKDTFESVVNAFPGISEAHAQVEPFWSSHFPNNPAKIEITLLPAKTTQ